MIAKVMHGTKDDDAGVGGLERKDAEMLLRLLTGVSNRGRPERCSQMWFMIQGNSAAWLFAVQGDNGSTLPPREPSRVG